MNHLLAPSTPKLMTKIIEIIHVFEWWNLNIVPTSENPIITHGIKPSIGNSANLENIS